MFKKRLFVLSVCVFCICLCAFNYPQLNNTSQKVESDYKLQIQKFIQSVTILKSSIATKNEKKIQAAFLKARLSYKQIECVTEYFYPVKAKILNGAPIQLADDLDMEVAGPEPTGFQVIEPLIFPHFNLKNQKQIYEITELLLATAEELLHIQSGMAYTEETIFDALIEQTYRITASGLTGFDSPIVLHSIPETGSSLSSVEKIIEHYKEYFSNQISDYDALITLLKSANEYLIKNPEFNTFDRSFFIRHYLNPITNILCQVKLNNGFKSNASPNYYASISKSTNLFNLNAFSIMAFTDDRLVTADRINLGRLLFFEKKLSSDNSRSCADCHNPQKGFTDGLPKSLALNGHASLTRNSPTLWNVGFERNLFMDGRGLNLEHQVIEVLSNKKEMNESAQLAALKIISLPEYKDEYKKVYPLAEESDAAINIANAIACYERTLISFNSRFDKYMRGDTMQLNNQEINGFNLFAGKARCATCHFIPLFNGTKPPRYYFQETEVIGVPATTDTIHPELDSDSGRFLFTHLEFHKFSFKTPTLRNIAVTGPYMHNGVYKTLEEVMDFYEKGGGKGLKIDPPNQTLPFDKLQLTASEKRAVIEFMKALTDTSAME